MNEDDLILHSQQEDQDVFRQLVERYASLAERTARVLLASRSDAEDAVQEAWLDVWRALPSFQASRPFRPWLLAIVANRCHMKARQQKPVSRHLDEGSEYQTDASEWTGTDYDSELYQALEGLDDEQRRILVLRFYADLQLDEIAQLIDIPLGTVKSRLYRALGYLRTQLEKPYPINMTNRVKE